MAIRISRMPRPTVCKHAVGSGANKRPLPDGGEISGIGRDRMDAVVLVTFRTGTPRARRDAIHWIRRVGCVAQVVDVPAADGEHAWHVTVRLIGHTAQLEQFCGPCGSAADTRPGACVLSWTYDAAVRVSGCAATETDRLHGPFTDAAKKAARNSDRETAVRAHVARSTATDVTAAENRAKTPSADRVATVLDWTGERTAPVSSPADDSPHKPIPPRPDYASESAPAFWTAPPREQAPPPSLASGGARDDRARERISAAGAAAVVIGADYGIPAARYQTNGRTDRMPGLEPDVFNYTI